MRKTFLLQIAAISLLASTSAWAAPTSLDLPGVPLETVKKIQKITREEPLSEDVSEPATAKQSVEENSFISKAQAKNVAPKRVVEQKKIAPALPAEKVAQPVVGRLPKEVKKVVAAPPAPVSAPKPARELEQRGTRLASKRESQQQKDVSDMSTSSIRVIPGVNEILMISRYPNRLLSPYDSPKIKTVSNATIEVEGSVIYVTPKNDNPITMFITEKDGSERSAISLTLVPKSIPPKEVRVEIENDYLNYGFVGGNHRSPKAQKWEKSNSYIQTISDLMVKLALGENPPGYGLRLYNEDIDPRVSCGIDSLVVEEGQALDGHNMIAIVAKATNKSGQTIELDEQQCLGRGVLASAAWPTNLLAPGEATELYVVFKRQTEPKRQTNGRPSLLNN